MKHFLLKFDVIGTSGQQVTSAKLRLYNINAANRGGDFHQVTDNSWQEETVTWNNAPTAETTLLASLGAAGANDGSLTLWLDGTQQAGLTSIDNDTWRVDRARLGAITAVDATTSGTYYFDAFESHRSSYIGPLAYTLPVLADTLPHVGGGQGGGYLVSYKFVPPQQGSELLLRQAQDIAFTPIDDAYIHNGNPNNNYGSAITIQVDNGPVKHFLLKFDVSGINGQQVTSAKLRLYNVNAASQGGDPLRQAQGKLLPGDG